MNKYGQKRILLFEVSGERYEIIASAHSLERMIERNVCEDVVSGNIVALGRDKIKELSRDNEEAIVINEYEGVSVVAGFNGKTITIITVVDTENIYNNRGTRVERVFSN